MQIVSDNVKALLDRYAKITLSAYLDGQKIDAGIGACELSTSCGDAEAFSFGNACAASVSVSLAASMPGINGKRIQIFWSVDGTEHPLFTGKVEKAPVSAGRTTVECWDAMYYGGSDAFIPTAVLRMDVAAGDALQAVAAAMGVSVDPESLVMLSGITIYGGLGHLSEEHSNAAVAGYIAGLIGGNALIDRSGLLTIRKFSVTDFEVEPYAGGASAEGEDFTVTGLTLQREQTVTTVREDGTTSDEDVVYDFSAGDGTLMVNNPLADQAAAERAYSALEDLAIRSGSYSFPGGLLLDPGDVFTVHSMDGSYSVAAVMLSMSFDGGVKTTVSCGGAAPKGGAQGPINQALATLVADYARLRMLVAENADIISARISNLTVDDIIAGRIKSTDFASIDLKELYPSSGLYPSDTTYPNNGEQIIRGFEIDFAAGVIRGAWLNDVIEGHAQQIQALEKSVSSMEKRIAKLENALLYPKRATS